MVTRYGILYKCIGAKATIATDTGSGRYAAIFNSLLQGGKKKKQKAILLLATYSLWHEKGVQMLLAAISTSRF